LIDATIPILFFCTGIHSTLIYITSPSSLIGVHSDWRYIYTYSGDSAADDDNELSLIRVFIPR